MSDINDEMEDMPDIDEEEAERYSLWLKNLYGPPMKQIGYECLACIIVYNEDFKIEKFIILFENESENPKSFDIVVNMEDINEFSQGQTLQ